MIFKITFSNLNIKQVGIKFTFFFLVIITNYTVMDWTTELRQMLTHKKNYYMVRKIMNITNITINFYLID